MNTLTTILLNTDQNDSGFFGIIMIVVMVAVFYFLMIRPQSKKQKEIKKAREALEVDSKVVTAGGIYGKIKDIRETTFIVEIAPNVTIKIEKTSVYPVVEAAPAAKK